MEGLATTSNTKTDDNLNVKNENFICGVVEGMSFLFSLKVINNINKITLKVFMGGHGPQSKGKIYLESKLFYTLMYLLTSIVVFLG